MIIKHLLDTSEKEKKNEKTHTHTNKLNQFLLLLFLPVLFFFVVDSLIMTGRKNK